MTFILAIILIFFALPFIGRLILRGIQWWIARKVAHMQREAFEQAFGRGRESRQPGAGQRPESGAKTRSDANPHRRGKRIDPSVGEYVEYEEIEGFADGPQDATASSADETFVAESQIVDAEWEEIK